MHGFARQAEKLIHLELLQIVGLKAKFVEETVIQEKLGSFSSSFSFLFFFFFFFFFSFLLLREDP